MVDNKPGAGGIDAVMTAKSASIGRSDVVLLARADATTIKPLTYRAGRFDLELEFEPVIVVTETPMMFVSNTRSGPTSLCDGIEHTCARPENVTLGSTSSGSTPTLAGVLLGEMTVAQVHNVPLRSSGHAVQAIVIGDSMVSLDRFAPLLPLVKSGRLGALGVTSRTPLPGFENLPSATDAAPGIELTSWFMLFAPQGTPVACVKALKCRRRKGAAVARHGPEACVPPQLPDGWERRQSAQAPGTRKNAPGRRCRSRRFEARMTASRERHQALGTGREL